jgi:hypothetical protein
MMRTRTPTIRNVSPTDCLGLAASSGDELAVRVLGALPVPFKKGLMYPSTVRTQIAPRLRAPWQFAWRFDSSWDVAQRHSNLLRWLKKLIGALDQHTIWIGILEYRPAGVSGYLFFSMKPKTDRNRFMAAFLFCCYDVQPFYAPRLYDVKKGPAYYLRDIRYPCTPMRRRPDREAPVVDIPRGGKHA